MLQSIVVLCSLNWASLCSVAAVALLPGNVALSGLDTQSLDPAILQTFEIINTASSRWEVSPIEFFFDDVYPGYKCDMVCVMPYYHLRTDTDGGWGFDPEVPASLPFHEGELLRLQSAFAFSKCFLICRQMNALLIISVQICSPA